jgi:hypothetical protein
VAAVALNDDKAPSNIVPTSTSQQSAFVPATRLTNYVVAHSEYSSPLARRSVLTGVLAEDDGDADVATTVVNDEIGSHSETRVTDESKSPSTQSQ